MLYLIVNIRGWFIVYCPKCDKKITTKLTSCPDCASDLNQANERSGSLRHIQVMPTFSENLSPFHPGRHLNEHGTIKVDGDSNIIIKLASFWFPIVGLILYLLWKDTKPKSAKLAYNSALSGMVLIIIVIYIFFYISKRSISQSSIGALGGSIMR